MRSTEGFEADYKRIKERKSVSCTVLPGKWSHDDNKTWLDCNKTIHKARSMHKELIRPTEWDREKDRESHTVRLVLQALWEATLVLWQLWRGLRGQEAATGGAAASAMAGTVSSMLSQPKCLLFTPHGTTSNSKVHFYPLS